MATSSYNGTPASLERKLSTGLEKKLSIGGGVGGGGIGEKKDSWKDPVTLESLVKDDASSIIQAIKGPFDKLAQWVTQDKKKKIYLFNEGNAKDKALLGNKGANLCEMYRMGLPIPPGFILTTECCNEVARDVTELPASLVRSYTKRLKELEKQTGRIFTTQLAAGSNTLTMPLLFSVRSGSPVSMPGMMDTVLYLGVNDDNVDVMSKITGNERFALDTHRRFISSYGEVIFGIDKLKYEEIIDSVKAQKGYLKDSDLSAIDLKGIIIDFMKLSPPIPSDPAIQLHEAILSICKSWWSPRACTYRELNNIPDHLGTAVTVQAMVYGNFNDRSATGVTFTRNTSTGDNKPLGEYLTNASGEQVVQGAGKNKSLPCSLEEFQTEFPACYEKLMEISTRLERHYKNVQDIEFTVEDEKLWILQTRKAKRTSVASMKFAVAFTDESLITQREALLSVDAHDFCAMLHTVIDPARPVSVAIRDRKIGEGIGGVGGAVVGRVAFTLQQMIDLKKLNKDESVILVRAETSCSDIAALQLCDAVLTSSGGISSHAACIMRQMNKTAVIGVKDLTIDVTNSVIICGSDSSNSSGNSSSKTQTQKLLIKVGDVLTIDGSSCYVYLGALPLLPAKICDESDILLNWADNYKHMQVFSNSDTLEEAQMAIQMGVEGIGLVRTEHMFFESERLGYFQAMILSDNVAERQLLLEKIWPFQKVDFSDIFRLMQNKSVCIRLLDPPLHEFMPKQSNNKTFTFEIQRIADCLKIDYKECLCRWETIQEKNPMLGLRGARLSMLYPQITEMQVTAIISSAIECQAQGFAVYPEIMIPLVATEREVVIIKSIITRAADEVMAALSPSDRINYSIGVMLETPRSLMRVEAICKTGINFVSFGTNDLTSLMYGFSRDDSGVFIKAYINQNVFSRSPFEQIDTKGVGALMRTACQLIKKTNPNIRIGVCGNHAGDPESIKFFEAIGVDFLSCSSQEVGQAKIAAAKAHVEVERDASSWVQVNAPPFW